jgi:transposase
MRAVVNAILYIASTGCQWRQLPKDFPLASQVVVEIERSAGYAERIITRSIDRAGRG